MYHRPQSGMRENPASSRRHGSRFAVASTSNEHSINDVNSASREPSPSHSHPPANMDGSAHAASPHAATGGGKDGAITHSAATVFHDSSMRIPRTFEPLIGSDEAAKLLGNIHVKTLQRYARSRRIPGYQIGGHWYFRESELDAWLRHQINSKCQSVR
jgi:excisionase family DNA binding protein